jgi:hypothetical protein
MSHFAKQVVEVPPDTDTTGFEWYRIDSILGNTWTVGGLFFSSPTFARELWTYCKFIAKKSNKPNRSPTLKMKLLRVTRSDVSVVAYFDAQAPTSGYDPPETEG